MSNEAQTSQQSTVTGKRLFFMARIQGELDIDGGPDAFIVDAFTPQRIERLKRLSQLCSEEGLSEVREFFYGDWVACTGESVSTDLEELVVTASGFWFTCCQKNSDIHYETPPVTLDELAEAMEADTEGKLIAVGEESQASLWAFDEDVDATAIA